MTGALLPSRFVAVGAQRTLDAVDPRSLGPYARRISCWIVCVLFVAGLYFPSSLDGALSTELATAAALVLGCGLALLILTCGLAGPVAFALAASVFIIICWATLFNPFIDTAYGALMPVSLLAVSLCIHLKSIPANTVFRGLFTFVNVVNLTGVAMLWLKQPDAVQFCIQHYSAFYPELVPAMLWAGKPVLTFGTHSLAGFFFYVFFFACFRTYVVTGRMIHYLFALAYIGILLQVSSFSSYMFAGLASLQLVFQVDRRRPLMMAFSVAAFVTISILLATPDGSFLHEQIAAIGSVLSLDTNGFRGRYSGQGGLAATLKFIASNPFTPIGAGYNRELMYGDSGPIEYMLRGSVPLVLAIYSSLFLFLKRNLVSKFHALFLFGVILGFELGFSTLLYFRTQFILPFLVVYLNYLQRSGAPGLSESRPISERPVPSARAVWSAG